MKHFENVVLNEVAIEKLFERQLEIWDLARDNYNALERVELREVPLDGDVVVKLQYNPSRIISSTAEVDEKTIKSRECFFCKQFRPKQQLAIEYHGVTTDYHVQLNPYPIFPKHLVIQSLNHCRQEIDTTRVEDMLSIAKYLTNFVVFYNGPNSGASVPDHFHFQAGIKGLLPLQTSFDSFGKRVIFERGVNPSKSDNFLRLSLLDGYTNGAFIIESSTKRAAIEAMGKIYSALSQATGLGNGRLAPDVIVSSEHKEFTEGGAWEPMMNILCWWEKAQKIWRVAIFARRALRASCYLAQGEERILISPACVEMAGLFITPLEKDFKRVQKADLQRVLEDVSIDKRTELKVLRMLRNQPTVSVGIMHAQEICFSLNGEFRLIQKDGVKNQKGKIYSGEQTLKYIKEKCVLLFDGFECENITLEPVENNEHASFWLKDVVIGVNFHWERKEDQKFRGKLKFIVENDSACAINIVGVEDYLTSVISSEMSATASLELLKAHAVISRSWLLSQIEKSNHDKQPSSIRTDTEYIKWYDRDDHNNFDVCADDHCQRYQGVTRASTEEVKRAIDQTWGEVLSYEGEICDARFYKCCGGVLELFENAWEPKHYDYLIPVRDSVESVEAEIKSEEKAKSDPSCKPLYGKDAADILDLTDEVNATAWILADPDSLCNTHDAKVLGQVLNKYDQETADFYRWKVVYTQSEIADLIREKSGEDFGQIIDLISIERGASGRIVKLKIVGTKKSLIVGKELEIRRLLSKSHLYSSAFVVRRYDHGGNLLPVDTFLNPAQYEGNIENATIPEKFEFMGAGWGHGVGLCQIGAAVMGEKGYKYNTILSHYYPHSQIAKKY